MKIQIKDADKKDKIKNELREFMKTRKHLVWYVKDPENLPAESVVEHTLNYGDWDDVQTLIKILGVKKMAEIFRKQNSGFRTNYDPQTINYFTLYFNKYAPGILDKKPRALCKFYKSLYIKSDLRQLVKLLKTSQKSLVS